MDDFDPETTDGSRDLFCPHFLACHAVRYDGADADAGYTLERVIVHVRPGDGNGFPFRLTRLCLFAQLFGTPSEYALRIWLHRIKVVDNEEVVETRRDFGPWVVSLLGESYVECYAMALADVWFPEPAVYEFQLWADGFDEPLARERIQARE
jgi:hypothetical protein